MRHYAPHARDAAHYNRKSNWAFYGRFTLLRRLGVLDSVLLQKRSIQVFGPAQHVATNATTSYQYDA